MEAFLIVLLFIGGCILSVTSFWQNHRIDRLEKRLKDLETFVTPSEPIGELSDFSELNDMGLSDLEYNPIDNK